MSPGPKRLGAVEIKEDPRSKRLRAHQRMHSVQECSAETYTTRRQGQRETGRREGGAGQSVCP